LALDRSAGFICLNIINVVVLRFGEDIPGMEWLGTGMYIFSKVKKKKSIIKYYVLSTI